VFAEFAVVGAKGSVEVRVDVELPNDFAVSEDRNHDFGLGFERAGEIAGIGIDIVNDDGFAGGGCGTTDALIEGNSRVGRHGALEGAEDEDVVIAFFLEHVEADPIVAGELFMKEGDDAVHERVSRDGSASKSVELGNQIRGLAVCGGHGVPFTITGKRGAMLMGAANCRYEWAHICAMTKLHYIVGILGVLAFVLSGQRCVCTGRQCTR